MASSNGERESQPTPHTLTLRLPTQLHAGISREAAELGLSLADVARLR
jgi:predicted HicB family RNase H-like nuclease